MNICKKKPGCDLTIRRKMNGRFEVSVSVFNVFPDHVIELNGYPMNGTTYYGNLSWLNVRGFLTTMREDYPRVAIPKFVHDYFDYQTKVRRVFLVIRSFFN